MYVPHSGDMNYIIASSESMYKAYSKFISRVVNLFKSKQKSESGKRFRVVSLNNA
jgi:hypothetical protein